MCKKEVMGIKTKISRMLDNPAFDKLKIGDAFITYFCIILKYF
jgi:hypothetical protein